MWLAISDINRKELVTSSLLADSYTQCPLANSKEFPPFLINLAGHLNLNSWLPLLPDEMLVAKEQQRVGAFLPNFKLILPRGDITSCVDKWEMYLAFRDDGIPTPYTSIDHRLPDGSDLIIKPRIATGSKGIRSIQRPEAITFAALLTDGYVIQEKCFAPELTIDAFYDPNGDYQVATVRERIEVKLGVTTKARVFFDDELTDLAARVARCLSLEGSFCFQVMASQRGWLVTDVNPRPGGASAMCAVVGQDFFAATFAYHWNEDWSQFLPPTRGEHFVTRQYSEFLML